MTVVALHQYVDDPRAYLRHITAEQAARCANQHDVMFAISPTTRTGERHVTCLTLLDSCVGEAQKPVNVHVAQCTGGLKHRTRKEGRSPCGNRPSSFGRNPYALLPALAPMTACAAARRAIGMRNGEHDT